MIRLIIGLLTVALFTFGANADGVRCGNSLVEEGDSVGQLNKACGEPESSYSNTDFTAPDKMKYKDRGGMTCTVTQSNGTIDTIDCNR